MTNPSQAPSPAVTRRGLLRGALTGAAALTVAGCAPNPALLFGGQAAADEGGGWGGACAPNPDGRAPWQTAKVVGPGWSATEIAEQAANVSTIMAVCVDAAVTRNGMLAALTGAFAESLARNLTGGDRDSVGMYQQRPSQGWGSPSELVDPAIATGRFLRGHGGNKGLLDYDYDALDPWVAAQTVQRSFDSTGSNYQRFMDVATAVLACSGTGGVPPAGELVQAMLATAMAEDGDGYVLGTSGPDTWDCSSLTGHAMRSVGIVAPRTAQAQRDWLAAGAGVRVEVDAAAPGDLFVYDSYLGPSRIGHIGFVLDPLAQMSFEAYNPRNGVGSFTYSWWRTKNIFEVWRLKAAMEEG